MTDERPTRAKDTAGPIRYVALLRGINVGSGPRVAMADLRRVVAALGHHEVRTYLGSGNVVFDSQERDPDVVAAGIGVAVAALCGTRIPVITRTDAELAGVVAGLPYPEADREPTRVLVAFLSRVPDLARIAALTVPAGETAEFTFAGREIYLHYPDGFGLTRFHHAYLEKSLGVTATIRNWRSVRALANLTAGTS